MGAQFTALEAVFDANAKPFLAASRQVQGSSTKASASISAIAKSAVALGVTFVKFGAIVTAALGGAGYALAKLGAGMIDVENKWKVVFKGVEKEITPFINDMRTAFNVPKTELLKWTAQLQDTLYPITKNREEAAKLSVTLTKLALDFSSFYNIETEDAISRVTSALVGNHEAVRGFGIVITEAALKNKAFEEGLGDNITELSVQEKMMLRLKLIMEGSSDAQGDFTRTAKEGSNTFRLLWMNVKELGRVMGAQLLPAFEKFNAFATEKIGKLVRKFQDGSVTFKGVFMLLKYDAEVAFESMGRWGDNAMEHMFGKERWERIKEDAGLLWDWLKDKWGNITAFWSGSWSDIYDGFDAVMSDLIGDETWDAIEKQIKKVGAFWLDAWDSPEGVFGAIKQGLTDLIEWLKRMLKKMGYGDEIGEGATGTGVMSPKSTQRVAAGIASGYTQSLEYERASAGRGIGTGIPVWAESQKPSSLINMTVNTVGLSGQAARNLAEAVIIELRKQGISAEITGENRRMIENEIRGEIRRLGG